MTLKDNLKRIRKAKRIGQRELARMSGLSFSMVSKLESGEQSNPTLETIEKIAGALNASPSELIGLNQWELFINYLKSIGCIVEITPDAHKWHSEDVLENGKVIGKTQIADDETYTATIIKGDVSITLNEDGFELFQANIVKAVEFELFHLGQK